MNIYIAKMPEVFGCGYTAFSQVSGEHAKAIIQSHYEFDYNEIYGALPSEDASFEDQWEYVGGRIKELDLTRVHSDDLEMTYLDLEDKEAMAVEKLDKLARRQARRKVREESRK